MSILLLKHSIVSNFSIYNPFTISWECVKKSLTSVTKYANFWKFRVTNFLTKISKIFGDLWGNFENLAFSIKLLLILFGQLRKKSGPPFILTPGHTGLNLNYRFSFWLFHLRYGTGIQTRDFDRKVTAIATLPNPIGRS